MFLANCSGSSRAAIPSRSPSVGPRFVAFGLPEWTLFGAPGTPPRRSWVFFGEFGRGHPSSFYAGAVSSGVGFAPIPLTVHIDVPVAPHFPARGGFERALIFVFELTEPVKKSVRPLHNALAAFLCGLCGAFGVMT